MQFSWLPIPCDGFACYREGFTDYQDSWFWRLLFASINSEWPGYLPMSADLWRVARAHCSHCFDKDSAKVLAAFERAEVAGRGVIYFRPLIEIVKEQSKKIRKHKPRGDVPIYTETQISTENGSSSLSLDLDFKKEKEKQPISPKLAERMEKKRRDGLTEARKRGLRNYSTHPLESWEGTSAFAAAGD